MDTTSSIRLPARAELPRGARRRRYAFRLMVVDRKDRSFRHLSFADIGSVLPERPPVFFRNNVSVLKSASISASALPGAVEWPAARAGRGRRDLVVPPAAGPENLRRGRFGLPARVPGRGLPGRRQRQTTGSVPARARGIGDRTGRAGSASCLCHPIAKRRRKRTPAGESTTSAYQTVYADPAKNRWRWPPRRPGLPPSPPS